MKRLISAVLILTLAFACLALTACNNKNKEEASELTTGFVYEVKKDADGKKYAVATKYTLSTEDSEKVSKGDYGDLMVDVVINEYEVDGEKIPVKEISAGAFTNQLVLRKVTIGENVEKVGLGAFAGCANLKELVLNFVGETKDAVNEKRTLGYLFGTSSFTGGQSAPMVFANGGASTAYYLPTTLKKVTVTGDTLSDYAFNNTSIETVELTGAIEYIGEGAFMGMTKLTQIKMPSTVKEIGKYAFQNATALYKVDFSAATALTTIYQEAFAGCSMLGYGSNTVTLPQSLSKLYDGAFKNCTSLTSIDLTGTQITRIPTACFYGCDKLTEVKYNAGVEVGNDAIPGNN